MKVKFPAWRAFEYVEVFQITERRDGCVYRTQSKGFARATRTLQKDEVYAPLSTSMTKGKEIVELKLID